MTWSWWQRIRNTFNAPGVCEACRQTPPPTLWTCRVCGRSCCAHQSVWTSDATTRAVCSGRCLVALVAGGAAVMIAGRVVLDRLSDRQDARARKAFETRGVHSGDEPVVTTGTNPYVMMTTTGTNPYGRMPYGSAYATVNDDEDRAPAAERPEWWCTHCGRTHTESQPCAFGFQPPWAPTDDE